MKRFGLPQCPYCDKKVNPLTAWFLRTQGEYICPKCGGVANVVLDPLVKVLGVVVILLGLVFFILAMVDQTDAIPVFYAVLIALPFVLFSILSAFFVHLKRPVLRKREPKRPQNGAPQRPAVRQGAPRPDGAVYGGRRSASGAPGSVSRVPQGTPGADSPEVRTYVPGHSSPPSGGRDR